MIWSISCEPNRANYHDTNIGTTSGVGCFPGGVSPYGIQDISGNVWEWMRSLWGMGGWKRRSTDIRTS
jgi:formylglycine-generating enzyme required for sulfatase activity